MKNFIYFIFWLLICAIFACGCGQTEAKNVSAASIHSAKSKVSTKCPCEGLKIETGAKGGRYCMVVSKKSGKPYKRYLAAEQCL